jgi:hypothetical protein
MTAMGTPETMDRMDMIEHADVAEAAPIAEHSLASVATTPEPGVPLWELTGCKYPVDEVTVDGSPRLLHVFCDRPRIPDSPWCDRHWGICVERSPPRGGPTAAQEGARAGSASQPTSQFGQPAALGGPG